MTKVIHLSCITASNMALNVFSYTVASSLFISNAGPDKLPLAYIVMGLLSTPIYAGFSQIMPRLPHAKLFQLLLGIVGILALSIRLFVGLEELWIYYLMLIGFCFFSVLLVDIIFPSFVSDYFTTLDWKRHGPFLSMAQSVGGLLGAGLTGLLTLYLKTEDMLLLIPLFSIVVISQITYLQHQENPLSKKSSLAQKVEKEKGPKKSYIMRRHPIIIFLAINGFLLILLFSLAEFQYFTIYANYFRDGENLTRFLGFLRAVNDAVEFLTLYFFTRPLIQRLGVSRLNLLYGLTTLVGFLGVAINPNLSTGIFLDLNYSSFQKGIDKPVQNLNYNAVPHHFVGQVRSLCDGLFSSLGLVVAGTLLLLCQSFITLSQIAYLGIALSLAFVIVRYYMGKSYLKSLINLLRSKSVTFEQVSQGLVNIPQQSAQEIIQLLQGTRSEQLLGLQLAIKLNDPSELLPGIEQLTKTKDEDIKNAIVSFLSSNTHPNIVRFLAILLWSENEQEQWVALESIITSNQSLINTELRYLLRRNSVRGIQTFVNSDQPALSQTTRSRLKTNSILKALICVAAWDAKSTDPEIQAVCDRLWASELDKETQLALIHLIHKSGKRHLLPLLEQMLNNTSYEIQEQGLEALASFAHTGDQQIAQIAVRARTHSHSRIRAIAYKLLGIVNLPSVLSELVLGLEDSSLMVRLSTVSALANYGERILPFVKDYLASPRKEVVDMAIAAIAKVGTHQAQNLLYQYLEPDYRLVAQTQRWLQQLPNEGSEWKLLEMVIDDYHQRFMERVLYVLSNLDHESTVAIVRQNLNTNDARRRAHALETLASTRYRRFVFPIMPLLECVKSPNKFVLNLKPISPKKLLEKITYSSDTWVALGALWTLGEQYGLIPERLLGHSNDLISKSAFFLKGKLKDEYNSFDKFFLPDIFFLKTQSIFSKLFLEEIRELYSKLEQKYFKEGDIICSQASGVGCLYIIYSGRAGLYRQSPEGLQFVKELSSGQHFGQISVIGDFDLSWTAIAQKDCQVWTLSEKHFEQFIDLCPRTILTCI